MSKDLIKEQEEAHPSLLSYAQQIPESPLWKLMRRINGDNILTEALSPAVSALEKLAGLLPPLPISTIFDHEGYPHAKL